MRLFGHNCRVEKVIERDDMVSSLPAWDKSFLGGGDEKTDCVGDGSGNGFGNNTVVRVVDRDRACLVNGGRRSFGDDIEKPLVKGGRGVDTIGEMDEDRVKDGSNQIGDGPIGCEGDAIWPRRGVRRGRDDIVDVVLRREDRGVRGVNIFSVVDRIKKMGDVMGGWGVGAGGVDGLPKVCDDFGHAIGITGGDGGEVGVRGGRESVKLEPC